MQPPTLGKWCGGHAQSLPKVKDRSFQQIVVRLESLLSFACLRATCGFLLGSAGLLLRLDGRGSLNYRWDTAANSGLKVDRDL